MEICGRISVPYIFAPTNTSQLYSRFQLAKKYIHYYFTASNGKGHGVHSPFVFEFIKFVMNDKTTYPVYKQIEDRRKELLNDSRVIEVEDFGAGSSVIKTKQRVIKNIAASSLKPKKYAQLLFRMTKYYKAEHILELGTSFGTTGAYLASADEKVNVITMEGSAQIAAAAEQTFEKLSLKNIHIIKGDFEKTLPGLIEKTKHNFDLIFLDGNHRKEPTLRYFRELLPVTGTDTIMIFDDIHWSREMEEAWAEIKNNDAVTLTIDLFFIGIVLFKKDFKVKQHFTVRF